MMDPLRITVLSDNRVERPRMLAEHGWACWVETSDCRLLFDTGQGRTLFDNADELAIPLDATQAIVLSHGHYDHTGGLHAMVERAPGARVFVHPSAFEAKYGRAPGGEARDIGVPGDRGALRRRIAERLTSTTGPTEICANVRVTGPVPRVTDFEDTNGYFYLDSAGQLPDPIIDDQALFVRTAGGTVVVLGCAHAGVVNTLQYVGQLTQGAPIRAVIGGMHLCSASAERMQRTIAALRDFDVAQVVAAHCTGANAFADLRHEFGDRCTAGGTGLALAWA